MILDDWQKEVLDYEGDLLLCTGRQIGKTTIMAIKAAEYMVKHKGAKIIIISLTEDQAKLIIVMILDYLEKNHKSKIQKRGANKPTQNRISLLNKSTAIARPVGNTGDAIRGFTGDVLIIDEASRMPELAFVAAEPVLMTTGGQIWICSTPFGKKGYFWRAFNDTEKWKIFYKSSEDVVHNRKISEDWTEEKREKAIKRLEKQKSTMGKLEYGQEYLGLFLDDLRQFFDDELINAVCRLKRPEKIKPSKYYLGVDLARMGGDELTWEIIEDTGNFPFIHVESIVRKEMLTNVSEEFTLNMAELWKVKKVGLDAGAGTLGVSILDHLMTSRIRNKVVALNNRKISLDSDGKSKQRILKEDMYFHLKSLMERGQVLLLDDEEVKLSLKSVQMDIETNDYGITNIRIFGNYTHIAEGLIRAVWLASKEKTLNLFATSSNHYGFQN